MPAGSLEASAEHTGSGCAQPQPAATGNTPLSSTKLPAWSRARPPAGCWDSLGMVWACVAPGSARTARPVRAPLLDSPPPLSATPRTPDPPASRSQAGRTGSGQGCQGGPGYEPQRLHGVLICGPAEVKRARRTADSRAALLRTVLRTGSMQSGVRPNGWVSNQPLRFCRALVGLAVLPGLPGSRGGGWSSGSPLVSPHSSLGGLEYPWHCDQNWAARIPQTWVQILGSNPVPAPLLPDRGCTAVFYGEVPRPCRRGWAALHTAPAPAPVALGEAVHSPASRAWAPGEVWGVLWPRSTLTRRLSPALPRSW